MKVAIIGSRDIIVNELDKYLPEGNRDAPLRRNIQIIEYSDEVIAFWVGKSRGTKHVINTCIKIDKNITVFEL